jgi:hypothetical protein
MSQRLLERLKSEDFALTVGFLVPSPALGGKLRATREVQEVIAALAEGRLTDEEVRAFVSMLLADLRQGERFAHDLALAALAVALEGRTTALAQEYLQELADLERAEMSTSIRVARECLRQRVCLGGRRQEGPVAPATR